MKTNLIRLKIANLLIITQNLTFSLFNFFFPFFSLAYFSRSCLHKSNNQNLIIRSIMIAKLNRKNKKKLNKHVEQKKQGANSDDDKSPTRDASSEKTGWTHRISRWFSSVRSDLEVYLFSFLSHSHGFFVCLKIKS